MQKIEILWTHAANKTGKCPHCGAVIECASRLGDEEHVPKPGDVTICIECAEPSRLTDEFLYRRMTENELAEVAQGNPDLLRISHAIASLRGKTS